jgi:hypothetical protein
MAGTQKGMAESGYMETTTKEAIEILKMQKIVDASSHKQKKRELTLQIKAIEEEERQHKEAEETARASNIAQAEKATPPQEKTCEEPKTSKGGQDIKITVIKENGTGQEVEVDVSDVPPGAGQRATVTDMARYLADNQGFGEDFGIIAANCDRYKGEIVQVQVYVTVKWEGELGKVWEAADSECGTNG